MSSTDKFPIDVPLVRRLVDGQFPEWSDLPIRPVEFGGWDNKTFHLGEGMTVRLPSAAGYVPQVEKEHRWLPELGRQLPLTIPAPLAKGKPTDEYPWPWSVYRWLDGDTAAVGHISDLGSFASSLAEFLVALQQIDPAHGPLYGPHSFYRGGPLTTYDDETRRAIKILGDRVDTEAVTAIWEAALASTWDRLPVWIHGDIAPGNLLVTQGRLSAVIDFGCSAIGDPACDLAIAWTLFSGESRKAFRAALPLDDATWARGRGWTLWKALIVYAALPGTNPKEAEKARWVIDELLFEHRSVR